MPKLKQPPGRKRSEIIAQWKRHWGIPDDRAAACLGMSSRTLSRRFATGDWSVDELHKAIRAFRIPDDDALLLLTIGCESLEKRLDAARRNRRKNEMECGNYV